MTELARMLTTHHTNQLLLRSDRAIIRRNEVKLRWFRRMCSDELSAATAILKEATDELAAADAELMSEIRRRGGDHASG